MTTGSSATHPAAPTDTMWAAIGELQKNEH